ncbi:MAG TPA: ATP-binding protein [Azospirillum sp.]|nr:ATP-binding protein [Azospirillum sp.]
MAVRPGTSVRIRPAAAGTLALWPCLALLLVAALGLAFAVRSTTTGLGEIRRLENTWRHAEGLLSLLKDVETGQRGFTATGDPQFLEPYADAWPRIGPELDVVAADLPQDAARRLRDLVGGKLDQSTSIVALSRSDLEAARTALVSGEGKRLMDAVRAEVAAIVARVGGQLVETERRVRRWSLWTSILAFSASALACLIAAAAAWMARRRSLERLRFAEERRERAVAASRRTEAVLRENEEHHRHLLELNPQVLWTAGPDGAILDFNQRWLDLTGLKREDALGEGWMRVPHPDDVPAMVEAWMRSVETGEPYDVEHRIRLADGSFRWMRSRAFARRGAAGAIVRWYGATEDIHSRKLAELQRAELQTELLHATRVSTMGEVAGTLAHELNQPLGAVLNYIDGCRVLLGSGRPEAQGAALDALAEAQAQAVRAGEIIRRLRQYIARARTERRRCDLNALVREAAGLALGRTGRAGIRVVWDLAADLPPVSADPVEIQQVVVNLLRNAVEAMEHGGPLRELGIATAPAGGGRVELAISDTGPGLPEEVGRALFKPFVTTKPEGMGLGLSICRFIVTAHGGTITGEPNPGGGARFRISLPAALAEKEVRHA